MGQGREERLDTRVGDGVLGWGAEGEWAQRMPLVNRP